MSRLAFQVVGARAEPYSAAPLLTFRLRVSDGAGEPIHALALRAQLQLEPRKRRYNATEEERLVELFGTPERWGDTLKTVLWTHVSTMIPAFTGVTEIDVQIPCTYDFEVASSKYFYALDEGEIPVLFLFSGSIFKQAPSGFAVEQVPWESEAAYRLPVSVWRDVMDLHFPNCAWIRLRRDAFDDLYRFKAKRALPTWEDAIAALLEQVREPR